jgi:hypothetical protein
MIPKVQTSLRFKEEYSTYQKKISQVTDKKMQTELTEALLALKGQVQFLDRCHDQLFMAGKLSTEVSDIRASILKYRKILDQKLAAWDRSQATIRPAPLPSEE